MNTQFVSVIKKALYLYVMAEPKPLVLCGPSGSGKTTLLKRLIEDFPDRLGFSISHTTRKPRSGEKNGIHYHFIDNKLMQKEIEAGKFIETATFSGNMYGTSKKALDNIHKSGKICVLDIDTQGVRQVKKTGLKPWCIFIKPPSMELLEARLRSRSSETEESLKKRLQVAKHEIEYGESPGNFDFVIVNDDLEHAYTQLKTFVETNVLQEASKAVKN